MSDEFYHFGVPGMKWGVRKSIKNAALRKKRFTTKTLVIFETELKEDRNS